MKVNSVVKTVFFCSLSYYLISRLKLYFAINLSLPNKNALFLLVLLLTIVIHNLRSVSVTTSDDGLNEDQLMPYQSDEIDITIQEFPNNHSATDELIEEKYVILVEKFSRDSEHARAEEEEEEEERIIFDSVLRKEADTGWRHDLIQKPVQRLEFFMVEEDLNLAPTKVKEIACVDHDEKWNKLDSDAVNRKYEEFIRVQRRKWRLDAV